MCRHGLVLEGENSAQTSVCMCVYVGMVDCCTYTGRAEGGKGAQQEIQSRPDSLCFVTPRPTTTERGWRKNTQRPWLSSRGTAVTLQALSSVWRWRHSFRPGHRGLLCRSGFYTVAMPRGVGFRSGSWCSAGYTELRDACNSTLAFANPQI